LNKASEQERLKVAAHARAD